VTVFHLPVSRIDVVLREPIGRVMSSICAGVIADADRFAG
jgi:hypothetical protein